MGAELGLDNKTINSWLGLLEASFIAFRLQPYYNNFNKRIVKTPKVYFYDTGLLCYLLGIRSEEDLNVHFAKGQLFENLIILELLKKTKNLNGHERYYFWRDSSGNEIDVLMEKGQELFAIEIKSGKTIHSDFFKGLNHFQTLQNNAKKVLVYGGKESQKRTNCLVLGVNDLEKL